MVWGMLLDIVPATVPGLGSAIGIETPHCRIL
jgi:hypothetical protein